MPGHDCLDWGKAAPLGDESVTTTVRGPSTRPHLTELMGAPMLTIKNFASLATRRYAISPILPIDFSIVVVQNPLP
ncbi:hypothetical protein SAMN05444166_3594 [Singulisphaera sp. GP187]|nr:hypothetical protein SAMN05444166_3594 [Singulisphaera sp. GP187]